ncbi:DUF3560 domain-containing protein [Streptomyces sp. MJM1172]|uniref:DUF3560 domain-containing protein n=1 Tax=Streptomyces sp. MJM1172 TaxID=1703926 RepID=UPI00093D1A54|nr:DUF3560 domain-containing protein [Streptomyces sp. MJM1172]
MTTHQVESAAPVDNRFRTVTLAFAGDGECSACGREDTPLYSGGELARVCPVCVAATFPPPPWEGDCPPEKADVVITHTRADGTLLEGSRKGDGIFEAIRPHGWRYFPSLGSLGLTHSRDTSADRYKIDPAAKAIRELGFTVCIVVNEDERRAFADAEADREQRAESRAERFENRASRATASSDASYQRSKQISERFYMGQPILVGHHSEGRARRDHARMNDAMRKSISEGERAQHWAQRAEASGAYADYRTNPARTLRRIETKEADLRGVVRWQRGEANNGHTVRLSPAVVVELSRRRDELTEELGYWRSIVAKAEAEGFKVWGASDFTRGDFVRSRGSWYEVLRVNPKTLTVAWNLRLSALAVVTAADATFGDGRVGRQPVDYSDVKTRMSAGDMARYLERDRTPSVADAKALMDGGTVSIPQNQDQSLAEVEGSADIPERLRDLLAEGEQMLKLPEREWSFTSSRGQVYRVRMVTGRDVTDLHFQVRTGDAKGTAVGVGKDWSSTLEVIREHATAAGEHDGKQCQRCDRVWGKGIGSPQTPATCTPRNWSYCDRAAVAVEQDTPVSAPAKPKTKKRTSGPKMVIVTAAYGSRRARMVYANGRGTVREDIPATFIDAPEGVRFNEGPASAAVWQGVDEVLEKAGLVRLGGNSGRTGSPGKGIRAKITEREDVTPGSEVTPEPQGTDSQAN